MNKHSYSLYVVLALVICFYALFDTNRRITRIQDKIDSLQMRNRVHDSLHTNEMKCITKLSEIKKIKTAYPDTN